jgi:hypothetical protein
VSPEETWAAEDAAHAEFFDHVARALPGYPDELPAAWRAFRSQAKQRMVAGWGTFGLAYRDRDNSAEGLEELADFGNYQFFDVQVARLLGEDEEIDTALMAVYHSYLAYHFTCLHNARRQGAP